MKSHIHIRHYRTETDEPQSPNHRNSSLKGKSALYKNTQYLFNSNSLEYTLQSLSINRVSNQKLQKLEQQLNNIQKLKLEYQNRKPANIKPFYTKYSDKSKSFDKKHLLKPSQSPVLKKEFKKMKEKEQKKELKGAGAVSVEKKSKVNEENEILKKQIQNLKLSLVQKDHMTSSLREKIKQLETEISLKQDIIIEIMKSKEQIYDQYQKIKLQNERMEKILKNMLFQRQKNKLNQLQQHKSVKEKQLKLSHCSENSKINKINIFHQNHEQRKSKQLQIETIIEKSHHKNNSYDNPFQNVVIDKISTKQNFIQTRIHQSYSTQPPNNQEQKRQRVQNILDKLKIKINRY